MGGRARLHHGGKGSSTVVASSSSAPPALPSSEDYGANSFGSSLVPEDFVRDDEHATTVVMLCSKREAAECDAQL